MSSEHDPLTNSLKNLPTVQAPETFSQGVFARIAEESWREVLNTARVSAPPEYSKQVLQHIAQRHDGETKAILAMSDRVNVPENFARYVSRRIAEDATPEEVHNPMPLYLWGGVVAIIGLAFWSTSLPEIATGLQVLYHMLFQFSNTGTWILSSLFVLCLAVLIVRPRFAPQLTGLAFAMGVVVLYPHMNTAFGLTQVAAGTAVDKVLRVGGTLNVAGTVQGDVVVLGGDVVVQPSARVGGQVVSILGDITGEIPNSTALLGRMNGKAMVSGPSILNLGIASGFIPLTDVLQQKYWTALYFMLVLALMVMLLQSGQAQALLSVNRENNPLAMGFVLVLLSLPAIVLSNFVAGGVALVLSMLWLLGITAGLAVFLLWLGQALSLYLPISPVFLNFALFGSGVLVLSLPFPALSALLWFLGGCFGVGVMFLHTRQSAA